MFHTPGVLPGARRRLTRQLRAPGNSYPRQLSPEGALGAGSTRHRLCAAVAARNLAPRARKILDPLRRARSDSRRDGVKPYCRSTPGRQPTTASNPEQSSACSSAQSNSRSSSGSTSNKRSGFSPMDSSPSPNGNPHRREDARVCTQTRDRSDAPGNSARLQRSSDNAAARPAPRSPRNS